MRKSAIATAGGIFAAFLASLCCIGPILLVTLGVGAGLATTFEPLRPVFGVLALVLFGFGFYVVYGRKHAALGPTPDGQTCVRPGVREKAFLWIGIVIATALWLFPKWSVWLL